MATRVERAGIEACISKVNQAIEELNAAAKAAKTEEKENEKEEYNFIIRAYSYLFGVPILALTTTSVLASDINGEIV